MENWVPAFEYNGLYEVSDMGNCRRISRGKKLTADMVEEALRLFSEGATLDFVSKKYNVSIYTAFLLRKRKSWAGNPRVRYLKPQIGSDFYLKVFLCKDGKPKGKSMHRLIWESFNGEIAKGLTINHKNLDREDNRLCNLELVTAADNIRHAITIYKKENKSHNNGGRYHEKNKKRREKQGHRGSPL